MSTNMIDRTPNGIGIKAIRLKRSFGYNLAAAPRMPLMAPDAPTAPWYGVLQLAAAKARVPARPATKYITTNGRVPIDCSRNTPMNIRARTLKRMCSSETWLYIEVRTVYSLEGWVRSLGSNATSLSAADAVFSWTTRTATKATAQAAHVITAKLARFSQEYALPTMIAARTVRTQGSMHSLPYDCAGDYIHLVKLQARCAPFTAR